MKKYRVLFLAIALCFVFSACNAPKAEDSSESSVTQSTKDSLLNQQEQNMHIELRQTYIDDLNEYEAYITSWPDLSNFVTYEMIKSMGEFEAFIHEYADYSEYMYSLQDGTGDGQILYVDAWTDLEPSKIIADTFTGSTLQKISTPQTGIILQGKLEYWYASGELHAISWREGDLRLTLGSIDDYPNDVTTTFTGRLLSAETAQATIAGLPIPEAIS